MDQTNESIKCRYYNQGYCKKKNNCKYLHQNIDCEEDCSSATCTNRHRIQCKNGDNCYYYSKNICEFLHDNMIQTIKVGIKAENRNFRTKIDELETIIEIKDNELRQMQIKLNQILEINKNAIERIENLEKRVSPADEASNEYIDRRRIKLNGYIKSHVKDCIQNGKILVTNKTINKKRLSTIIVQNVIQILQLNKKYCIM